MLRGLVNKELRQMGMDCNTYTMAQESQALITAKEKYLAMQMLDGANKDRFGKLKEDIDLDYGKGRDIYPTIRNVVLQLLNSKNNTMLNKLPQYCLPKLIQAMEGKLLSRYIPHKGSCGSNLAVEGCTTWTSQRMTTWVYHAHRWYPQYATILKAS